ncbi:MAG: fibronectin type III domain-containing protein [Lachnospiraceae bacterium]|nr:fibronectin type III domain-containing protein [Lachnospiraceae bacterium]
MKIKKNNNKTINTLIKRAAVLFTAATLSLGGGFLVDNVSSKATLIDNEDFTLNTSNMTEKEKHDYEIARKYDEILANNAINFKKPNIPEIKIQTKSNKNNILKAALKEKYDPRKYEDNCLSPVKDQGNYGTCWTYASLECLQDSYHVKNPHSSKLDFSEWALAYFSYAAPNGISNDPLSLTTDSRYYSKYTDGSLDFYQGGGDAIYSFPTMVSGLGLVDEENAPYTEMDNLLRNDELATLPMSLGADKSKYFVDSFFYVPYDEDNLDSIKQNILEYGAGELYYASDSKYYDYKYSSFYNDTCDSANHAVSVVGWNDNYPKEYFRVTPENDGAWLIKNSWGDSFCDGGYFWISYEDTTISDYILFSSLNDNNTDCIFQYTKNLYSYMDSFDNNNTSICNQYTAEFDTGIEKVGYWFSKNQTLHFELIKNTTAANSSLKKCCAEVTFTAPEYGFYTLDLEAVNNMNTQIIKGSNFVIKVTDETDLNMDEGVDEYKDIYTVSYCESSELKNNMFCMTDYYNEYEEESKKNRSFYSEDGGNTYNTLCLRGDNFKYSLFDIKLYADITEDDNISNDLEIPENINVKYTNEILKPEEASVISIYEASDSASKSLINGRCNMTFTLDNPEIAYIDKLGRVFPKKPGTSKLTITIFNVKYKTTLNITSQPITSLTKANNYATEDNPEPVSLSTVYAINYDKSSNICYDDLKYEGFIYEDGKYVASEDIIIRNNGTFSVFKNNSKYKITVTYNPDENTNYSLDLYYETIFNFKECKNLSDIHIYGSEYRNLTENFFIYDFDKSVDCLLNFEEDGYLEDQSDYIYIYSMSSKEKIDDFTKLDYLNMDENTDEESDIKFINKYTGDEFLNGIHFFGKTLLVLFKSDTYMTDVGFKMTDEITPVEDGINRISEILPKETVEDGVYKLNLGDEIDLYDLVYVTPTTCSSISVAPSKSAVDYVVINAENYSSCADIDDDNVLTANKCGEFDVYFNSKLNDDIGDESKQLKITIKIESDTPLNSLNFSKKYEGKLTLERNTFDTLEFEEGEDAYKYNIKYTFEGSCISINEDNEIYGLLLGTTTVTASYGDLSTKLEVSVVLPENPDIESLQSPHNYIADTAEKYYYTYKEDGEAVDCEALEIHFDHESEISDKDKVEVFDKDGNLIETITNNYMYISNYRLVVPGNAFQIVFTTVKETDDEGTESEKPYGFKVKEVTPVTLPTDFTIDDIKVNIAKVVYNSEKKVPITLPEDEEDAYIMPKVVSEERNTDICFCYAFLNELFIQSYKEVGSSTFEIQVLTKNGYVTKSFTVEYYDDPNETEAPSETPESTDSPEATETPTIEPVKTDSPEAFDTSTPSATQPSTPSATDEISPSETETTAPSDTGTPVITNEPADSNVPEATDSEVPSTNPEESIKPSETSIPEDTGIPDVTDNPEESTIPKESAKPKETEGAAPTTAPGETVSPANNTPVPTSGNTSAATVTTQSSINTTMQYIKPPKVVIKKIKAKKKKQLIVKWKKLEGISYYQIDYSKKKKFKSYKRKSYKADKKKCTIKKLKSKKKYYIRIRAVNEYPDGTGNVITVYGDWTKENKKTK